jgi:hypothetical protein
MCWLLLKFRINYTQSHRYLNICSLVLSMVNSYAEKEKRNCKLKNVM